ncbi:MAG TPA: hypothetical protein VFP92_13330 [Rhodanobacteraceae bacterium]|nr:hypothetical protein [Rhodanobacteraceae bacterium]
MREMNRRQAWTRLARGAALSAGVALLAGCATGYSFVQPDVAGSGGYYTSEGPYSGQGYYDDYGTGPYYSGTSAWGYYNGSYPYSGRYGYYGSNYGYGSQWIFNLGISNVWNFPGYWGPWYTLGYPSWGCYTWRCGNHHRHHGHKHGDRHDQGSDRGDHLASERPLNPDFPPRLAPGTPPVQIRSLPVARQPQADFAHRRPVDVNAFRHDRFVQAPRQYSGGRPIGAPARLRAMETRAPAPSAFVNRPTRSIAPVAAMPPAASRAPRVMPRPTVRPVAPARAAPVAPPPPRHGVSRKVKIQ